MKDTKSSGDMLKETNNINRSLFTLGKVLRLASDTRKPRHQAGHKSYGDASVYVSPAHCTRQVIAALAENQGGGAHIPYRDSKLTKVPGFSPVS